MRSLNEDLGQVLQAPGELDTGAKEWRRYGDLQMKPDVYSFEAVKNTEEKALLLERSSWERGDFAILFATRAAAGVEVTVPKARAENRALRSELAELREEHQRLREEQQSLRGRIKRLEHRLDEMLSGPEDMETVPVDPHTRWIEDNLETLRSHPDEWIALHPVRGILFHSADGDEFASMLGGLTTDERDEVLAFHTSMYV